MLLSNKIFLLFKSLLAVIFISVAISACTFSPIYSDKNQNSFQLSYAKPNTRLEQIVYSDLKLRLGETDNISSQKVIIKISSSTRSVGRSSDSLPTSIKEVKLKANITLLKAGDEEEIVFKATRTSSASYITNGQAFADQQAAMNASEVTALELAQIIRLVLLGELNKAN